MSLVFVSEVFWPNLIPKFSLMPCQLFKWHLAKYPTSKRVSSTSVLCTKPRREKEPCRPRVTPRISCSPSNCPPTKPLPTGSNGVWLFCASWTINGSPWKKDKKHCHTLCLKKSNFDYREKAKIVNDNIHNIIHFVTLYKCTVEKLNEKFKHCYELRE